MARASIPLDSTILTVAAGLKEPVEYVRNVLAALAEHRRDNGNAQVRLSLQGDAAAPNYQIETIMDPETGQPMALWAYSGKTHRELSIDKIEAGYWSTECTDFSEVSTLIGMLRRAAKGN
jgi:hypothetical protein